MRCVVIYWRVHAGEEDAFAPVCIAMARVRSAWHSATGHSCEEPFHIAKHAERHERKRH